MPFFLLNGLRFSGDACYFKHEMMDDDRRDVSRNEEMEKDLIWSTSEIGQ